MYIFVYLYRTYVDLIDLTPPSDSEGSELDEPPAAINLHGGLRLYLGVVRYI